MIVGKFEFVKGALAPGGPTRLPQVVDPCIVVVHHQQKLAVGQEAEAAIAVVDGEWRAPV